MKYPVAALIAAAALALAGADASAQQYALTSKDVNLRAGPARDYPIVAVLPPQVQVLVYGCIPSYTWCDVMAGPDRGWVYAGNLLYDYGNRVVILPSVAAVVGIGIATFIIDDYWHDHYSNRWWWPQRQRWYRPYRAPPVREHGRDYRDQRPDYRDPGRDHREQRRDPRDPGREFRGPPRSGQGQYPAPRAGVAPAAPQVQRNPRDTMRRAPEQRQPPQQQRHQPREQQRQQEPRPLTQ